MYPTTGQLTLAFHGCDQSVKDKILSGRTLLRQSQNQWDWLGHGIYFWESDPVRAKEFAWLLKSRRKSNIKTPAAIGAVLDLGNCLNLLNRSHIRLLKDSYLCFEQLVASKGDPMPVNRYLEKDGDPLLRDLDCAVINYLHDILRKEGKRPYDSVRGAFWEGNQVYRGAGFRDLSHIQICVRNPNCIKAYFDPLKHVRGWPQV